MVRTIIVMLFAFMLAGCGAKQAAMQPLDQPGKPIAQKGYTFTPPDESGWYVFGRNAYSFAMARQGESTDETYALKGVLFRMPLFESDEAFVAAIKQGQAQDTDIANPDRFKVRKHDVELYSHKGESCTRSHIVTEDHGAKKRTDTPGAMILEVYALVCRHPEYREAAISFDFSQRYYDGYRDAAIEAKAKQLFDTFEFTALKQ